MGDAELDEIRAKRMAELQSQFGGGESAQDKQKAAKERENQMIDAKNMILSQALDQDARARLNTLMICKPEKGKAVENLIINMVQSGRIRGRVTEAELIALLTQISTTETKTTTVKFDRRRAAMDSSDEEF